MNTKKVKFKAAGFASISMFVTLPCIDMKLRRMLKNTDKKQAIDCPKVLTRMTIKRIGKNN